MQTDSISDPNVFFVPKDLVRDFINECTQLQLKVLLVVFAYPDADLKELAEYLGAEKAQVAQALEFWQKKGMLEQRRGREVVRNVLGKVRGLKLTTREVAQAISDSLELNFIAKQLPKLLGRLPNSFDMANIVNFSQNFGMQPELILQLINYCVMEGKTSAQAIKKEAEFWFERGVTSLEAAEEYIKLSDELDELQKFVMQEMGFKMLDNKQKLIVSRWKGKFELKMISRACEIARGQKETSTIAYVNGILNNWQRKGFKTIKDVGSKGEIANQKSEIANTPVFSPLLQDF